ncbi:hypothetical protein AMAG_01333 [Allomyces macrogynus ATCC 38327]|uniref:Ribosomal RNA-processing protein 14/surfeit locus protein 6 C-terminal domain-containing protein n=1 Tax=Allomyces macrogynus (strain ATCC 38327) TaxID=578462 RepID=A0A0L0RYI2_ALLM3|nr:hypothetical protein AMAG_01333 [Allomyces macrogynus ATCC 38327]|eukprot:KNE55442.1 hypothetical protein AMAG_01333 [Allomyces macrogynus ATCC 38327]
MDISTSFPALDDLRAALEATSKAINQIVDLIPAEFWFVEDHEANIESKYMHKKRGIDVPETKAAKKPKRSKLNPDDPANAVTARQSLMAQEEAKAKVDKQQQQSAADADSDVADDDASDADTSGDEEVSDFSDEDDEQVLSGPAMTVQERLAALRLARQPTNPKSIARHEKRLAASAEERKSARAEKKKEQKQKQKHQKGIDQMMTKTSDGAILSRDEVQNKKAIVSAVTKAAKAVKGKSADAITEDVSFGNVDFGEDKKKTKGPAKKDIKAQLAKAEKHKAKIAEIADKDAEKAKAIKEKGAWVKALKSASGEKIKDDTRLLKKALKRKEKEKEKKKEEWAKRTKTIAKEMRDRQKKRAENIQKKLDDRKARKTKKGKK